MSDLQDLPLLDQAMVRVQTLEGLLEDEFVALKDQDLDQFEVLLSQKKTSC